MKIFLKFILLVVSLFITFILTSSVLYSQTLKTSGSNVQVHDFVYLFISCFWICLTVFYVTIKSHNTSQATVFALVFSLSFVYAFMPQFELLLFDTVYASLDVFDSIAVLVRNVLPVIIAVILGSKLFGTQYKLSRYAREPKRWTVFEVIIKLLLTALGYVIIYFLFGYFVFWRMGASHVFYNDKNHETEFMLKVIETWNRNPEIYLIEYIKGFLYALFVLPVIHIFRKRSLVMFVSLALILEMPTIYLIIPDLLFRDTVRIGHIGQLVSTMLLFAFIAWLVFDKVGNQNNYKKIASKIP